MRFNKNKTIPNKSLICLTLFLLASLWSVLGFAVPEEPMTLGDVAQSITNSMESLARLITAGSYVAGIGFAMMGLLKLKAHKDQPAQVPLSQPLVLLIISAGLVFMPSLIGTFGETMWKSGYHAHADGSGLEFLENS